VLIEGSVLDQSPAQPGTPAVSKESMTAQMEYLHMSRPQPTTSVGVPVELFAVSATSNTLIDIGSATTNANGKFAFEWTPPDLGVYTITAQFNGDESYWSSMDTTGVSVSPAPSAAPEASMFSNADYAIMAVVFIAILIGIVNILLLRKNK
jgi:hypothetical protein